MKYRKYITPKSVKWTVGCALFVADIPSPTKGWIVYFNGGGIYYLNAETTKYLLEDICRNCTPKILSEAHFFHWYFANENKIESFEWY